MKSVKLEQLKIGDNYKLDILAKHFKDANLLLHDYHPIVRSAREIFNCSQAGTFPDALILINNTHSFILQHWPYGNSELEKAIEISKKLNYNDTKVGSLELTVVSISLL